MSGKRKRSRGDTCGRYSSMIKGYVKGGSFVKRKMHADSKASLGVASAGWISARWLVLWIGLALGVEGSHCPPRHLWRAVAAV